MSTFHFLFILPNIYEITNGVSKKYIRWIESPTLSSHSKTIILTRSSNQTHQFPTLSNTNFIITKGLRVPFYTEIKVPIISDSKLRKIIKSVLKNGETNKRLIIVFHGEFIWLYDILEKLKKERGDSIKIYPNWHTDYEYYIQNVYKLFRFSSSSFVNRLQHLLFKKIFEGIIVTGKKMVERYQPFTSNIFNANELDLSIYNSSKLDIYESSQNFNWFYTGRISREKNIELILPLMQSIQYMGRIHLHIIGDGPYLEELKDNSKKINWGQITFYGKMKSEDIFELYMRYRNRFFIFPSTSETFGKSPFEASACGIPIFIKESDVTPHLFENRINAMVFREIDDFVESFEYFMNMRKIEKDRLLQNAIQNCQQYEQQKIFRDWTSFLIDPNKKKNKNYLSWIDYLTFESVSQVIQCSGNLFGEN